jgi:hypothetical protein
MKNMNDFPIFIHSIGGFFTIEANQQQSINLAKVALTFSKVEHNTQTNYELIQGDEDKTQL